MHDVESSSHASASASSTSSSAEDKPTSLDVLVILRTLIKLSVAALPDVAAAAVTASTAALGLNNPDSQDSKEPKSTAMETDEDQEAQPDWDSAIRPLTRTGR